MVIKKNKKKIRILQVVYKMDRGGVETSLMRVLRHIDSELFEMHFLVHSEEEGYFDKEILALGSNIIRCTHPKRFWRYESDLKRILIENGPYNVIHPHGLIFDGIVMKVAHELKIPIRIIQSHNNVSKSMPANLIKKLFIMTNLHLAKKFATKGLAYTNIAAESYFGKNWQKDPRWRILMFGEDFSIFNQKVNKEEIRTALGLPKDVFIIGHVGSFRPQKNHTLILKIMQSLLQVDPDFHLLLIGDGPMRVEILNMARSMGIESKVTYAGLRADVPQLMLGAMDLFLFPSITEGLGWVILEAQAAGLPCLCSDQIPSEAVVIPALVTRMPLSLTLHDWIEWIIKQKLKGRIMEQKEALKIIENSKFNIQNNIIEIENIFQER